MINRLTLLAIIEILSALSIGVLILFLTYRIVKWIGRRRYGIETFNPAYGIIMAGMLFATGYTVSCVIEPLLSLFRIMANSSRTDFELVWAFISTGAIYIATAYVLSLLVCWIGIAVYIRLTPLDEFAEIKNNNLAVALTVGIIVITLNLLARDGVALLIESLVPYPDTVPM